MRGMGGDLCLLRMREQLEAVQHVRTIIYSESVLLNLHYPFQACKLAPINHNYMDDKEF